MFAKEIFNYIKENKFGIYAEVVDTISDPKSVIYTSRIYLKMEISPKDLIDLIDLINEVSSFMINCSPISNSSIT